MQLGTPNGGTVRISPQKPRSGGTMTTDMNVNRSSSEVLRKPIIPTGADNGFYLWLIVGCGLGGVILLTFFITLLCIRRRRQRKKNSLYRPGQEFCPQNMISSFSSTSSSEASEPGERGAKDPGKFFRRPLGPSTSLDPPALLRLTRGECVQPLPQLTRWHTVASSSHCRTVPGTLDIDRDSDDEDNWNGHKELPCLHGRLWFSMLYNNGILQVTLVKAKYLPGRGLSNSPRDPFVKIFLLPDEENFRQSKIRKRTLNPKFNETFEFNVSPEEVHKRTLKLSVYDMDKRKVRHCLGHVLQPLDPEATSLAGELGFRDLEIASQAPTALGDIQLCLSCNPYSNRIKTTVNRVRNLQGIPQGKGVHVAVQLYHGRKVVKIKTTQTHSISQDDAEELVFEETFSFGVSGRYFDSCSISFSVIQKDGAENCHTIGSVVLGPFMYARGEALQHWQEMLTNPRNMIVRWHPLEPPKPAKKIKP
ncbi:hypothetical protein JTE90_026586 [Oedothorax gibbosus]|uniref:C2 domain-containing protein n=1 Tax=Oedothorax gibbosus TaxID=931172 RepID=A0AAV6TZE7_9ARAC|nr:hypothetical protein JTE90_026586 [Oedothorax gibbosus]